eukprot:4103-Heterococcus_DN1.PRE.1
MKSCKVLNGMWQLSGAHGFNPQLDPALNAMQKLASAGFTTFDLHSTSTSLFHRLLSAAAASASNVQLIRSNSLYLVCTRLTTPLFCLSAQQADHYGPAEPFVGQYRVREGKAAEQQQFYTKWVPRPEKMSRGT